MNLYEILSPALQTNTAQLQAFFGSLEGEELMQCLPGGGGQHALWLMTHILMVEDSAINSWVLGKPPIMAESWRMAARPGATPAADAAAYPSKAELLDLLARVRANSCKALTEATEAQFAEPPLGDPPAFFTSKGFILSRLPIHAAFHTGQMAAVRRMLNKPVAFI